MLIPFCDEDDKEDDDVEEGNTDDDDVDDDDEDDVRCEYAAGTSPLKTDCNVVV